MTRKIENKFARSLLIVSVLSFGALLLSGCDEESDADIENDTVAQIGSSQDRVKPSDPLLKTSSVDHIVSFNDKEVKLKATYGIDEKRLNNWWFTTSSTVNLELGAESIPSDVEIRVNNVYSEVSIISNKAYKNGIRQDSLNQSYSQLDSGGISIDPANNFTLPFQVEGINQNETSFYVINGYGSSDTKRLTESDVREGSQGGVLNTVWTVLIKDKNTNQSYMKTINDKIGLPCKEDTKKKAAVENEKGDSEDEKSFLSSLFGE